MNLSLLYDIDFFQPLLLHCEEALSIQKKTGEEEK